MIRHQRQALKDCALGIFCGVLFAAAMFALCGCAGPVTPKPVPSMQASFDEGAQTSGLTSLVPGGAIITELARARYNALIATYGHEFLPALDADHGVTVATVGPLGSDGRERRTYFITSEALQKFVLMNTWRRSGREPSKKQ